MHRAGMIMAYYNRIYRKFADFLSKVQCNFEYLRTKILHIFTIAFSTIGLQITWTPSLEKHRHIDLHSVYKQTAVLLGT